MLVFFYLVLQSSLSKKLYLESILYISSHGNTFFNYIIYLLLVIDISVLVDLVTTVVTGDNNKCVLMIQVQNHTPLVQVV